VDQNFNHPLDGRCAMHTRVKIVWVAAFALLVLTGLLAAEEVFDMSPLIDVSTNRGAFANSPNAPTGTAVEQITEPMYRYDVVEFK
jgi:hypothetical protein